MANLTEDQKTQIKQIAASTCMAKGIKPLMDSVVGTIPNPAFQICVTQEYNTALSEAEKGGLAKWVKKSNDFVKANGGLTGLLENIATITSTIKDWKTTTAPPPGYANYDFGKTAEDVPETKKSYMWAWMLLLIVLVVLIILTVMYFRRHGKNAGNK